MLSEAAARTQGRVGTCVLVRTFSDFDLRSLYKINLRQKTETNVCLFLQTFISAAFLLRFWMILNLQATKKHKFN